MSTLGSTGRVGGVVLFALLLFGGMWLFFSKNGIATPTYVLHVIFADASGISKGVDVQMAGVKIGSVDDVSLNHDNKADLKLKIKEKYKIPQGSHFVVVTPILGNTGVLTVLPAATSASAAIPPNSVLVGDPTVDLTTSLSHAGVLLDQITHTAKKVDVLIDQTTRLIGNQKFQHSLDSTLTNLNMASANGVKLTDNLNRTLTEDNAQVKSLIAQTRAGAQTSLNNIADTTAELKSATHDNRGKIDNIIGNLQDTTSAIAGITGQTNDLLKNGQVSKNLSATVANLKTATDKLNVIAGNLQQLSSDPAIQGDLKQTLHNIRDTTEQTTLLVERVNHLIGAKPKTTAAVTDPASTTPSSKTPLVLPQIDLLQNTRARHFRADLNAFVPIGGSLDSFGRVGIYGFGDANKLNLQYGRTVGKGSLLDYRFGLYASKLSVGTDLGLNRQATLSLDYYDPNRAHLDARGVFMLSNSLGVVVGAEDITHRSGGLIGLELRH